MTMTGIIMDSLAIGKTEDSILAGSDRSNFITNTFDALGSNVLYDHTPRVILRHVRLSATTALPIAACRPRR